MIKVYPLRVCREASSFINYTYLLVNESTQESILIDPGAEFSTISDCLYKTKSTLSCVLLTHHHVDHTQLAGEFASAFDIPVFISAIEKEYYDFICVNLTTILPDKSFTIGGLDIFPFHTPGHTKGSLCFGIDNYLFTGDTLFIEGCGMCFSRQAATEMFYSIQRLKKNIAPSVIVYPGHSYGIAPGVTFAYLLTQNIYCHLNDIRHFVDFRVRKNQRGHFDFK